MAMPPTSAPAPAAAGADPAMAGGAPADDMGAADDSASPPVLLTVLGNPGGPFTLMAGDEPEGEGDAAASAPTFETPQALMQGIMQLLNPSAGAESSFAKGFKGEDDPTASKPDMPPAA